MLCKLPLNVVKNHKNNNKRRKNYRQMRDDLLEHNTPNTRESSRIWRV
ncbi:hypothetical protein HMPREF1585_01430 [Gardnerella vaginalis JCP8481B]|nr:hypothetical protein HMPREF1585_01430 [Gardnerella vaginalis JCP8481B]